MLLQTYKEHQHIIEGTFSLAVSKVKKGQAWTWVLTAVNSVAVEPCTLKQVRKLFKNDKSAGKYKYQAYVKETAKTRGPPLKALLVVSNFNGNPVDGM